MVRKYILFQNTLLWLYFIWILTYDFIFYQDSLEDEEKELLKALIAA